MLPKIQPLIKAITQIGQDHGGKSNVQVALNWLICKGALPIPGATPFGTLGAVIVQRAPFEERRSLFDIGVAGPLARPAPGPPERGRRWPES